MNSLDTSRLEEALRGFPLLSQEGKGKDAICIAIFALGSRRWFIIEGEREHNDTCLYGIAVGMDNEEPAYYGHFFLSELERLKMDLGSGPIGCRHQKLFHSGPLRNVRDNRLQKFLSDSA